MEHKAVSPARSYAECNKGSLEMNTKLNFNNIAKVAGTKGSHTYYDWVVYLDEKDDVLSSVEQVTYFLHNTFPDPIRIISNKHKKFGIKSRGWGVFKIGVSVQFKNGSNISDSYELDLSKPWDDI
jgi:transcription initiation factor IIF auxiliary subunit